jgi:hypothetical protein
MAAPSPSVKKISDIKSTLLRPALTSHFLCEFRPPDRFLQSGFFRDRIDAGFDGLNYKNQANQELITLSCSEASLPGTSLATIDIDNDYHGVSEKHAYRRLYDDRADFTFYVDGDYKIIHFFENWLAYCAGEDDIEGQKQKAYSYRANYPIDYQTENLYITKFERDKTPSGRVLQYKFINAYPLSISSMPVSYDSSQLLKCSVSFFYSRYIVTPKISQYSLSSNPNSPGNVEFALPTQGNAVTLLNSSGQPSVTRTFVDGRSTLAQLND